MSKKSNNRNEKNLDSAPSKEAKMNRTLNSKKKRIRNIPIPPRDELIALYHGTHPACNGRPFSQYKIAQYYSKKYNCSVSQSTVFSWFRKRNIKARGKIPIPPRDELVALYHGTHPACNNRPFTLDDIAAYYSKKYNRPVSEQTVRKWFRVLKIETRDAKFKQEIPIPPRDELVALYHGTHPACNNRPFTFDDIAAYYSKKYNRPVSHSKVGQWFRKHKISAWKTPPIPPRDELVALYHGTHPACNGRPFNQHEIAEYYSKKHNRPISRQAVRTWFRELQIESRPSFPGADVALKWEDYIYEIAEIRLANAIWKSGHGIHKILTPDILNKEFIEPEIIVFFSNGRIKKFIEAKLTIYALKPKDTDIYPSFTHLKLVEFWILFSTSHVKLYYPDGSIESRPLVEFDEDTFDPSTVDKVFVFINSDDLITQLQSQITESNREDIKDLINRIRRLQYNMPDNQTSLEDFLG